MKTAIQHITENNYLIILKCEHGGGHGPVEVKTSESPVLGQNFPEEVVVRLEAVE